MSLTRRQFAWSQAALALLGAAAPGLAFLGAAAPGLARADDEDAPINVFYSPCGQPFRAKITAPYPVVDWFKQADKDKDGKLDHGEFMADTTAFFKILDRDGDGVLNTYEVEYYERILAPEIIGQRFRQSLNTPARARMWLARQNIDPGAVANSSDDDNNKPKIKADESGDGAAPYSLLVSPEPVAAADRSFAGRITKADFLRLADLHFTTLDRDQDGYLSLAKLPKTAAQKAVEQYQRRHGIKV